MRSKRFQLAAPSVVLLAAVACVPQQHPSPSGRTSTARRGPAVDSPKPASLIASPLEGYHAPPPFSAKQIADEIEHLAEETDLAAIPPVPAVGALGRETVVPDPRRTLISQRELIAMTLIRDAREGAPERRIQSHQQFFARVPTARMGADGKIEVRVETLASTPSVSGYYGTVMPVGAIAAARYRLETRATSGEGDARRHVLEFSATELLSEAYDVLDARHSGRGLVAWRIEAFDAERGSSHIYESTTPFRCEPIPCDRGATFVQLPAFRVPPQVDLVGSDRATISFTTDAVTAATILIQGEHGDLQRFSSERPSIHHEIELSALAPWTRYRYQVFAVDHRGEVVVDRSATFRTAPAVELSTDVTFVALSDARSGIGSPEEHYAGTNMTVLRGLLSRALERDPAFILAVGDLVDGYTTEPEAFRFELEGWLHVAAPFGAYVPIYEAMGNHETVVEAWEAGWAIGRTGSESAEALFAEYVTNPLNGPPPESGAPPYAENVYSFDHGMVHIAVVNSNYWWRSHPDRKDHPGLPRGQREGWVNDDLIAWLDQDLRAARQRGVRYLFVATHEPGFPNGGHTADGMYWRGQIPNVIEQRTRFFRVLGKHRVGVLFAGDEHNYSRTLVDESLVPGIEAPVWQVVSGGAGAPYHAQSRGVPWADHVEKFDLRLHFVSVQASTKAATAEVVALSGEIVDRFEVAPATE